MCTKDVISQEVLSYEAVGRIARLLDQISDGLASLGVLQVMRSFPHLFVHLFTYMACVTPEDVLEAVYVHENAEIDEVVMCLLKEFISGASEEGL